MLYDLQLTTENCYPLNSALISVSSQNVLALACTKLKLEEADDSALRSITMQNVIIHDDIQEAFYGVYICPLQRPWNIVPLFFSIRRITFLVWSEDAKTLMSIDSSNNARIFQCVSGCLNQMVEIKTYNLREEILTAKHYLNIPKTYVNLDRSETSKYPDHPDRENVKDLPENSFICTTVSGKILLVFVQHEVVKSWKAIEYEQQFDISDIVVFGENRNAYALFSNFTANSPVYIYQVQFKHNGSQTTADCLKLQGLIIERPRRSVCFLSPLSHRRICALLRNLGVFEIQIWEMQTYRADVCNLFGQIPSLNAGDMMKRSFILICSFSDQNLHCSVHSTGMAFQQEVQPEQPRPYNARRSGQSFTNSCIQSICSLTAMAGRDGRVLYFDRHLCSVADKRQLQLNDGEWLVSICLTYSGCLTIGLTSTGRIIVERTYSRSDMVVNSALCVLEHFMIYSYSYWDVLVSILPGQVPLILNKLEQRFHNQTTDVQKRHFGGYRYIVYFLQTLLPTSDQSYPADGLLTLYIANILKRCREYMTKVGYRRAISQQALLSKVTDFTQELNYAKIDVRLGDHLEGKTFVEAEENLKIPEGLQRMSQWCLDLFSFLPYVLYMHYNGTTKILPGIALFRESRLISWIRELLVYIRIMVRIERPDLKPNIFEYLDDKTDITTPLYDLYTAYLRMHSKVDPDRQFVDMLKEFNVKLRDQYKSILLPALAKHYSWFENPKSFKPSLIMYQLKDPRQLLVNNGTINSKWSTHFDPVNMIPIDICQKCTLKVCVNCGIVTLTYPPQKQIQMMDLIDAHRCECSGLFLLSTK
ncbi:hypothetical protein GJ496_006512 [Pomphorhynchus laevis]|nr:hypothetical protein GJ496_006512 [Pomphorhynchus laevis]